MAREHPAHDAFPLRTVTVMTGLTPDLIRAWEKRYAVVAPIRGARGARLYTAGDISHLRLLARVVGSGRAIGDVAKLKRGELERLAEVTPTTPGGAPAASSTGGGPQQIIAQVLEASGRLDAVGVERALGEGLIALGGTSFAREIAAPLLHEVGQRWSDGRLGVADEHLISAALRGVLNGLIRSRGGVTEASVLLATPTGERHEFGLLLAALVIADAGVGVSYLGTDLPAAEIAAAARRCRAVAVGLSVVDGGNRRGTAAQLRAVERALPPHTELWLGGRAAAAVRTQIAPTGAIVITDLERAAVEAARVRQVIAQWR